METNCPTCGATTHFPLIEGQHVLACVCGTGGSVKVTYSFVFDRYFSFPEWDDNKGATQ
jgi:hypothetical protein